MCPLVCFFPPDGNEQHCWTPARVEFDNGSGFYGVNATDFGRIPVTAPRVRLKPEPVSGREFVVGDVVEARYRARASWYLGTITERSGDRYNIEYFDGDRETRVPVNRIQSAADTLARLETRPWNSPWSVDQRPVEEAGDAVEKELRALKERADKAQKEREDEVWSSPPKFVHLMRQLSDEGKRLFTTTLIQEPQDEDDAEELPGLPPKPDGVTRLTFGPEPFGITIFGTDEGLVVTEVQSGASGAALGVRTGDKLVELNGDPVDPKTTDAEFVSQLSTIERPVSLGFSRDGKELKAPDRSMQSVLESQRERSQLASKHAESRSASTVNDISEQLRVDAALTEDDIPDAFTCPITLSLMLEPYYCAVDGFTYEKAAIQSLLKMGDGKSPMTRQPIHDSDLSLNKALANAIQQYKEHAVAAKAHLAARVALEKRLAARRRWASVRASIKSKMPEMWRLESLDSIEEIIR